MSENHEQVNGSRFGKDFKTGCLAIVAIFVVVFILAPVAIFVLRISLALVLPIALIILIIIFTAFFGRIINTIIRKPRE